MINEDLKKYPNALHIKIYANRMELFNPLTQITSQVLAQPEYAHPRLLIGNFEAAEQVLNQLMKQGQRNSFKQNIALVQAMERTEHGFTQIEIRVLRELIFNSGIVSVLIYDEKGIALTKDAVSSQTYNVSTIKGLLIVGIIIVICLFFWQIAIN